MTEAKKSRFLPGLLIYLLILGLLLAAVLFIFRDFLITFEQSRPERALEQWLAELAQNGPDEACLEALTASDLSLQKEDDVHAAAQKLLDGIQLTEDLTASGEERRIYCMITDGRECGRLTLGKAEPLRYGFASWEVTGTSYDFSPWFYSLSVAVPENYSVHCGDAVLSADYITEPGVPYAALAECYETLEKMPVMVRYETGPLLSEESLRVFDETGREVPPAKQNEEHYLDNCTPKDRERMEDYAERFVSTYVTFTASKEGSGTLKSMTVPGSSIFRRIEQASGDSWWGGGKYCKLLSSRVNRCVDLGDGHLLLDLSYETETREYSETVTDSYSMRLILVDRDGTLLAEHSFNY